LDGASFDLAAEFGESRISALPNGMAEVAELERNVPQALHVAESSPISFSLDDAKLAGGERRLQESFLLGIDQIAKGLHIKGIHKCPGLFDADGGVPAAECEQSKS
jgi:hypothetical protein